jgi:hypothetical protein
MPNSGSTFALRLPTSLKKAAESLCKKEGISLNTFIVVAVAEKVATLRTVDFIEARAAKGDIAATLRFLRRPGGEPPREGDEIPKVRKSAKRSKSN